VANALKAIVIIMGLMILAALTLLGAIVAGRFTHRTAERPEAISAAPGSAAYVAPGIDLPQGAQVEKMTLAGNRLVLDVALPNGEGELIILDVATGKRVGTIPLHRTAPR
jgi:hypothetical protein